MNNPTIVGYSIHIMVRYSIKNPMIINNPTHTPTLMVRYSMKNPTNNPINSPLCSPPGSDPSLRRPHGRPLAVAREDARRHTQLGEARAERFGAEAFVRGGSGNV